ncbi:MAG: hypothetical protein FWF02_09305 [Micrococcales bacterium]|nr:hypothetical protein [Micrococcales bacterium]MCL2667886.1 hypothetical protein [Micrococcales bacterium]
MTGAPRAAPTPWAAREGGDPHLRPGGDRPWGQRSDGITKVTCQPSATKAVTICRSEPYRSGDGSAVPGEPAQCLSHCRDLAAIIP